MPNATFPIRNDLTAIALAYRNPKYVADLVLPRAMVSKQEFEYLSHTKSDGYTIPATLVGRKGRPNEVEFSASRSTSQTVDFGLESPVPQADIENAPPNFNPLAVHTELTTELIMLDREKRVADLVFATATYPAANRTTLSGTNQWSDRTASDPVNAILAALDIPLIRPNVMVIGRAAWTQLRQHPKITAAAMPMGGNASVGGYASKEAIADLFELDEIVVGEGFYNTAKPGQTASFSRLWGKHCALIYRNPQTMPTMGVTFGMTCQWGQRIAGSWEDRNIGLRGGQRIRVGESVKELITANDVGYYFENCVA